jgi:hypothetical protein
MSNRAPSVYSGSFHCPRCGAFSHHQWFELWGTPTEPLRRPPPLLSTAVRGPTIPVLEIVRIASTGQQALTGQRMEMIRCSSCHACNTASVWVGNTLIHPAVAGRKHREHAEFPDEVKRDFIEADEIHQKSPRGAAALLRLAIEKLCREITQDSKRTLDGQIEILVSKGLDPRVQKMLDIVRVIGNEAVHPGVMDLRDDVDTVQQLFFLMNEIAEEMIAKPKRLEAAYNSLPQPKLDGIEQRNKRATATAPASPPPPGGKP